MDDLILFLQRWADPALPPEPLTHPSQLHPHFLGYASRAATADDAGLAEALKV